MCKIKVKYVIHSVMIYDEPVFMSEGGVNRYVIGGDGEMMVLRENNPHRLDGKKYSSFGNSPVNYKMKIM